jgi:hypothetical protein
MGLDLHTVEAMNGSQLNRQDRLLFGLLCGVASVASAVAITALGAITAGTGFSNIKTVSIAPTGGTGSGLTAVPTSLKCVSATPVAPGSGYAINDTITLAGGTLQALSPVNGVASVLTVSKAQLVGLAINAGGSGYAVGDTVTLSGGTETTNAVVTVTSVNSGAITGFNITNAGVYTAEASTFTQGSTSGSGSGATFKSAVWGVNAVTVSTAGGYTAAPGNGAAQASTSGSGTGATFNPVFGLGTAQITNSGSYTVAPTGLTVTDTASGTGASIAAPTLGGNGNPIYTAVNNFGLPPTYGALVQPGMPAFANVPPVTKFTSGFTVELTPPASGNTLSAGTFDVAVFG